MTSRAGIMALVVVGLSLAGGCGDDVPGTPSTSNAYCVHLGEVVDAEGEGSAILDVPLDRGATVTIHLDGEPRVVEIDAAGGVGSLDGASVEPYDGGTWIRPAPHDLETLTFELEPGDGVATVTVFARGAPVPDVDRERSLVWIDPGVVDDPTIVGLGRVLAAASDDDHGGVLLDQWFRRFATTSHSERAAPAQLMDELAAQLGADPSTWDLDALPFVVTAVHNRHDLGPRSGGCGELRVSLASTHDIYAPLHLIVLFEQPPRADDIGPDGTAHCLGNARRWARLTGLTDPQFAAEAATVLDEVLARDNFLLAETVELTVSPWELRQWVPVGADELDNPPLFQTIATSALNAPGPLRDQLLSWVADNAEAIDMRTVEIPTTFRAASAQVPPSAPREELDLTGLEPAVVAAYPDLVESLEIVGCPRCHTDAANFVHTTPQRTFSDFYDLELDARAARLDALNRGAIEPVPPFGPLQSL